MATADYVDKWRAWKQTHPDFPLTVAPCGQWQKKVRGKVHYFGVLRDPDTALRLWLKEKDYLLAGARPPAYTNGIVVDELLAAHIKDLDERAAAGRLAPATRRNYLPLVQIFREAMLSQTPVSALGPQDFAAVQRVIEKSGRTLRTQKNVITSIRSVFNWAGPDGMGLIGRVSYGPRFVMPSLDDIEAEQEEKSPVRFFDRELILSALAVARPQMKVAIYLGINCGFYPGDTIAITMDHLHLDEPIPYHDFRRVKTKRRRMASLWPETVETITDYIDNHRRPLDSNEQRLLLTQGRQPYSQVSAGAKLSASFRGLLKRMGQQTPGVGLGSLRHTYATVIDQVPDQSMIDLTMGHTNRSIQKRTYRQLNLDELGRLRGIAEVVRGWLFEGGESNGRSPEIQAGI